MRAAPRASNAHKISWWVFIVLLLFATLFVTGTASRLPPTVASHFDVAGQPNAFMSRGGYVRFVLCFAVALPLLVVTILSAAYSRAGALKLPNGDYWLAPQRLERTRAFLVAHGVWFGSLLVTLACAVHWIELEANRLQPPHLPGQAFAAVLIAFLTATAAWVAALMFAFRRPAGQ
jgi:uncharacterized membrane protein